MITITLLAAALAAAVLVGSLVLMRLATAREDRNGHLPARATTRLAAAARSITGLYVEVAEPGVRARHGSNTARPAARLQAPDLPDDTRRPTGGC
jgi:hypothetical protein